MLFESSSERPTASLAPALVTTSITTTASEGETEKAAHTTLKTAVDTRVYVTLHGHFYQPPRENPWLNRIEIQPSAAPNHDWNERIWAECYRPNAFARIQDEHGNILSIVNNFEFLSFNMGATLLSWMEQHDIEVYQRIIAADRLSCERLNGHGNAIAQVYNHIILPLASEDDQRTQIQWGIADFRHRFGRQPEGMWLAETAIDTNTVALLVEAGIRFVILAPSQARRCRPMTTTTVPDKNPTGKEWLDVSDGSIDPSRPYRCYLPDRSGYLDLFFFDGPISRDMGFGEVLNSSHNLAHRLAGAVNPECQTTQLIQCATDGETFGHHKRGVEKTLAYAFTHEFPKRQWVVTNYAHYLSLHPPLWEVEIKPRTAWSCAHGVGRWETDCGCGQDPNGHLLWRRPLRQALNDLRDRLIRIYSDELSPLIRDPWLARNEYIQVILDPEQRDPFLHRHQLHSLSPTERTQALQLLEMQRYSQLMFTSCGWFFEELSRPEGVQILRYAAKAMELAKAVTGIALEATLLEHLATVPTNNCDYPTGTDVYQALVVPATISPAQVVAHYAITAVFDYHARQESFYGYTLEQLERERRLLGDATLDVGWIRLHASLTQESHDFIYAVLHLEGLEFQCGVQAFEGRRAYESIKYRLLQDSHPGSKVDKLLAIHELFGQETYNLSHLFLEDRQRMMHRLTQQTLGELSQLYRRTYLDNYGVMMAFRHDGLPLPAELQVAAQLTLNHRFFTCLSSLEAATTHQEYQDANEELHRIVQEAQQLGCSLHHPDAVDVMGRILHQILWKLAHNFSTDTAIIQVNRLEQWLHICHEIDLAIEVDRLQELYLICLERQILPRCQLWPQRQCEGISTPVLLQLLRLGQWLTINTQSWLAQLAQAPYLGD